MIKMKVTIILKVDTGKLL